MHPCRSILTASRHLSARKRDAAYTFKVGVHQRRHDLKNFGGRKLQCSDRQLQMPTEEITGAQSFNFGPNFPQHGEFPVAHFVFLEEHFPTRKFSEGLKFLGIGPAPTTSSRGFIMRPSIKRFGNSFVRPCVCVVRDPNSKTNSDRQNKIIKNM